MTVAVIEPNRSGSSY